MLSRLERMLATSRGDWTIRDIEATCREFGATCEPPRGGGSHRTVKHPSQLCILTVPSRRPIKPVYIRKLVVFLDAVRANS